MFIPRPIFNAESPDWLQTYSPVHEIKIFIATCRGIVSRKGKPKYICFEKAKKDDGTQCTK